MRSQAGPCAVSYPEKQVLVFPLTMMLWTWQGFDFCPPFDPVDRAKSDFLIHSACPNIHSAYAELDELLALPMDRKGQFLWCHTTESWGESWHKRCLWSLDVPQESILAYVNGPVWEHLIGSKSVPRNLREQWQHEFFAQQIVGEQYYQEMARKEREYHNSFPCRKACLEALLDPTGPAEDVSALVSVPADSSWIRPCNFRGQRRRGRRQ